MKYEQMTITGTNTQSATGGKTQAMKLRERMEAENGFEHFDDVDTLNWACEPDGEGSADRRQTA